MEKIIEWIKKNKFLIFLFVFSFLIRIVAIIVVDTPIISDFKVMYEAALELINGTDNYKELSYFIMWGYQMGHTIYQAILLLFWNSVFFLKLVNCIVTSFTVVFIYLICRKICSEKSARIASIAYSVFLFPLLLNTVLSNQQMPMLLILIALYMLLNMDYNKYIKNSIIIGLLLGLSNILRSETIVIIFSIFLYSIYLVIMKYDFKKVTISFVIIFLGYNLVFNGTSELLKIGGVSPSGLDIKNSYWKFLEGFNYETNGMYSNADAAVYSYDEDACKEELINRLKEFHKIPMLFIKKVKILWFNSDLTWSIDYLNGTFLFKILNIINQLFILLFNIFTFGSLCRFIKLKFDKTQVLVTLILLVYFGVYLLIEIMPRYAYSLQIFEAILIGITIDYIYKLFSKIKKKRSV